MKIWIDLRVLLMASVLFATLQGTAAKRSGLGRRAKSSSGRSQSGRSNQQHHYAPQTAPVPKPAAKESVASSKSATNVAASQQQQPIGWNVGNGKPSAPVGPPPPYPGGSHYYPGIGGAPPAYSPKSAHPPSYSSLNHGYQQSNSPYQQHAPQMSHSADSSRFYGLGPTNYGPSQGVHHNPYMSSGYGGHGSPYAMSGHGYYPGAAAGGFGGMAAAPMMMGGGLYGGYQKPRSSMFSLSNILTGVALYGAVRSLSGGGWGGGGYGGGYGYGPREVHIYDHRDQGKGGDTAENKAILQAVGVPATATHITYESSTRTPLAPFPVTASNVSVEHSPDYSEEMTLPPLPADNEPKIYFGYGFAYGYADYSVDTRPFISSTLPPSSEEKTTERTTPSAGSSTEQSILNSSTDSLESDTSQDS
ncbi:hypothetical protein DMENIID0001_035820 [Sergentomyia squamirostris]